MLSSPQILSGLCLLAACGFPRPADLPEPAGDAGVDASSPVTVQVSSAGNDSNDGLSKPVKTLKRAIAIAGTNTEITAIAVEAGRYVAGAGETFPYQVPANVTIAGPKEGGAILVGTRAENGLTIDTGSLKDLELENFKVAITGTGAARISNLKVRASLLAVQGETASQLTIDNLNIEGSVEMCGSGIVLKGSANLVVATLVTRSLRSVLSAMEPSTIDIRNADVTGDPRCSEAAFFVGTGKSFKLTDSTIVAHGLGIGIIKGAQSATQATIVGTTIRNASSVALNGGSGVIVNMTGGALLNNPRTAAELIGGTWNFTNVLFQGNEGPLYIQGGTSDIGRLTMRGCTVRDNVHGVALSDMSAVDLGTSGSPGNNTIQNNGDPGISLNGNIGLVEAVGNTWNPDVQEADQNGRYPESRTITGPVPFVAGNNFAIFDGSSLRR